MVVTPELIGFGITIILFLFTAKNQFNQSIKAAKAQGAGEEQFKQLKKDLDLEKQARIELEQKVQLGAAETHGLQITMAELKSLMQAMASNMADIKESLKELIEEHHANKNTCGGR